MNFETECTQDSNDLLGRERSAEEDHIHDECEHDLQVPHSRFLRYKGPLFIKNDTGFNLQNCSLVLIKLNFACFVCGFAEHNISRLQF